MNKLNLALRAGLLAAFVTGSAASAIAETWTKAKVREIDKEEGQITLRHEPLEEFGMPAMSMVFRATDPALLDKVDEGDDIEFVAGRVNGQFVVKDVRK